MTGVLCRTPRVPAFHTYMTDVVCTSTERAGWRAVKRTYRGRRIQPDFLQGFEQPMQVGSYDSPLSARFTVHGCDARFDDEALRGET